jgi:phosphoenolpyruvate---glycerone phosphotransferase subunit DhaL
VVSTEDVVAALGRVLRATEEAQPELDALDAVGGDGDHGVTMVLGWRAVVAALDAAPPASPEDALRTAAEAFAGVGGSAGPLWGTALLRAGRSFAIDGALAAAAQAAVDGMCERGRCAEGDRTVVDAMAPAARALVGGGDLAAAATAAAEGAARTAQLDPKRGRDARARERTRGHVDAGAQAASIFWQALATEGRPSVGDLEPRRAGARPLGGPLCSRQSHHR